MSTDLQVQCHLFAGGRPALAFSLEHLEMAVLEYGTVLAGTYPDNPHPLMRNTKLPVYNLAYSGFVRTLELDLSGGTPTLAAALVATVHPFNEPTQVIATYEVTLDRPLDVYLDYSESSRELRWAPRTSPLANVVPRLMPDAQQILERLGVPPPVLDTYERKVEGIIIWSTSNTFVQLVIDALPSIDIGEMAPWLTLQDPLQFDFGPRYLVVASERARMSIGDCTPVDVIVEPDLDFPYQEAAPQGNQRSQAIIAVYLPKTRLVQFVAKNVMPAIMYDTRERGGAIRWRMNGAFGLKEFKLDVAGGLQVGNPGPGDIVLRGALSVSTEIALTGVARAWINGPCGSRIGLASASIQGDGAFAADIVITYSSPGSPGSPPYGASLGATLAVTQSELDPNIDIEAVGWPIDDIIGMLTDHLVTREVHKLAGIVRRLGSWSMMSVPSWLVDLLPAGDRFAPVIETLEGVSTVFGINGNPG